MKEIVLPAKKASCQQGFIFVMTLIITAVISLLVLTSMQHILLHYKAINRQEELHQNFYQLEAIATQLAQHRIMRQECVSHQDAANQVVQKLANLEGCALTLGGNDYLYFIEELGVFPCLVVREHGLKRATYHRRVSVLHIDKGMPGALLQVRLISSGLAMDCPAKERVITVGITSWRYLASV